MPRPKKHVVREGRFLADDSFAALIRAFMARPEWKMNAASTQRTWAYEFRWLEEGLGQLRVEALRPSLVQVYFDGLSDKPGRQNVARNCLRVLEKWALKRELLTRPITTGLEITVSEGGHDPWSDEHLTLALTYARPHFARVVALALNTGQRCSDLVRMRWCHLQRRGGRLGVYVMSTLKVNLELFIPFSREFEQEIMSWPGASESSDGYILTKPDGRPWDTPYQPSQGWTYERDHIPALKPLADANCVLHGLRSTACVRLRRNGCSEGLISRLIGLSLPMVSRYCRHSNQAEDALAAVAYLDGARR